MPVLTNSNTIGVTQSGGSEVSQTAGLTQKYWIKRFALFKYVCVRTGVVKPTHSLAEVESTILRGVAMQSLYSDRNPEIIVCDRELSEALDVAALHCSELRTHLLERILVNVDSGTEPRPLWSVLPPVIKFVGGKIQTFGAPLNLTAEFGVSETYDSVLKPEKDARFLFSDRLLHFFRNNTAVDKNKAIFTFEEICVLLSSYIIANKHRLFDMRNIKLCICKGDPLEQALNVDYFHRSQVVRLLRGQMIPYMNADQSSDSDDCSSLSGDDEGRLVIDM